MDDFVKQAQRAAWMLYNRGIPPAPDGIPIDRHIRNMQWSERERRRAWHNATNDDMDVVFANQDAKIICRSCGDSRELYGDGTVTCSCGAQWRYVCIIETRDPD